MNDLEQELSKARVANPRDSLDMRITNTIQRSRRSQRYRIGGAVGIVVAAIASIAIAVQSPPIAEAPVVESRTHTAYIVPIESEAFTKVIARDKKYEIDRSKAYVIEYEVIQNTDEGEEK